MQEETVNGLQGPYPMVSVTLFIDGYWNVIWNVWNYDLDVNVEHITFWWIMVILLEQNWWIKFISYLLLGFVEIYSKYFFRKDTYRAVLIRFNKYLRFVEESGNDSNFVNRFEFQFSGFITRL